MIAKLQALSAKLYQEGRNLGEADRFLREQVMKGEGWGKVYVPPFDHPDIWEGASSLVPELDKQMKA
jgi:L-serine/L-threonine ammonia-lyase